MFLYFFGMPLEIDVVLKKVIGLCTRNIVVYLSTVAFSSKIFLC